MFPGLIGLDFSPDIQTAESEFGVNYVEGLIRRASFVKSF